MLYFLLAATTLATATRVWAVGASTDAMIRQLKANWEKPPRTYRPHTRWWWPGNALTKADISWQLEQMAAQGFGGVEIMNAWKVYERGNVEYLSPEFTVLVQHAVAEAKRLDLEVAITFSPGWSFGAPWVPQEDQSKALCMASRELEGGTMFTGPLPQVGRSSSGPGNSAKPDPKADRLVAVVAGRLNGDALAADSLTVVMDRVAPGDYSIRWKVPSGQWRLMAFWLKFTGQICQAQSFDVPPKVIDHLNQGAVRRYCEQLGGYFDKAVGKEFGRTVDSFFCDSFEIHPAAGGLLWSTDTLAGFKRYAGYDLTPYLPAIWLDIGPLTPRIRYDVGDYLSQLGLKTLFAPFNDWCRTHGLQARIQPHYRFPPELVQAAGATARPETEATTARFEPLADPRKATASGARFYGRDIVSAESYTFIHDRYGTDLQLLKIATDAFLRDGVTQLYNHGYWASPERQVGPTRDMPWGNCTPINHYNTWWPYMHHLAAYVGRCCSTLREGKLVADVLIYSPQATAWSERAIWGGRRRIMPYGDLAKTLVANGYDFDIVSDDLLQDHAKFRNGCMEINGHSRRVLILPCATVMPIKSVRVVRDFVRAGGTVIALHQLPSMAAGLRNYEANDRELKEIVHSLFNSPLKRGRAVFLADYELAATEFSPQEQPPAPTSPLTPMRRQLLAELGKVAPPDFELAGGAQSDGLTFIHKQRGDVDVYFVSNLQTNPATTEVTFRIAGKVPQLWDAISGAISAVRDYSISPRGVSIPVSLEPWQSAFYVFVPGPEAPAGRQKVSAPGAAVPEPLAVTGTWQLELAGPGFEPFQTNLTTLTSWADCPRTRHFSGTGRYEVEFEVPESRLTVGAAITLDLGRVLNIAEVELNGRPVGVAWLAPYRLDVSHAVKAGANKLVVRVTNLLINRVTGMAEPPPVPEELQPRLGTNRTVFDRATKTFETEIGSASPLPAGLLGPVRLVWGQSGHGANPRLAQH